MKLMLDSVEYINKPTSNETAIITNRIIQSPVDIDMRELAKELVSGKTVVPALFREKRLQKENWVQQQVIMLDFDNEDKTKNKHVAMTLQQAIDEFKNTACFIYETFSSTFEHPKFRVVFALEEPISHYSQFEHIITSLLLKYPQADKHCKNGNRLFFGGTNLIELNYENRLRTDDIFETPFEDIKNYLVDMSNPTLIKKSQPSKQSQVALNVPLIIERNIEELQRRINPIPIKLKNEEVYDYLKQQNLRLFLGLKTSGNFYDVFHKETNPSASIYLSDIGNGHHLYKCHSSSSNFSGSIIEVVSTLLSCSNIDAKNFLMKVYKVEVEESEAVMKYKKQLEEFQGLIKTDEFRLLYPYIHKVFGNHGYFTDLHIILELAKEFIVERHDGVRSEFFHSIRSLAKYLHRSVSSTGHRINIFTFFRFINKLDDNQIEKDILKQYKRRQKNKKRKYRSSIYCIYSYSNELLSEINELCMLWLEKGNTLKSVNYEGILRSFGKSEAERVFNQDKGRKLSPLNQDIVSSITLVTMKMIEYKGWATKKEIVDLVALRIRKPKLMVEKQFDSCIGELLDGYGLERIATNKVIKEELGITERHMGKYSFPKLIRKIQK